MRQTSTLEFASADRLDKPVMLMPAWVVLSTIFVIAMIVVARWWLVRRLRRKDPPLRSIGKWMKHLFEAIWRL